MPQMMPIYWTLIMFLALSSLFSLLITMYWLFNLHTYDNKMKIIKKYKKMFFLK